MLELASGWHLQIDHGSEWIFFRLLATSFDTEPASPLSEALWSLAAEQGIKRIVIELAETAPLTSYLIGQIVLLHKRAVLQNGTVRLCGFSADDYRVVETMGLAPRLPNYRTREDAVMGWQPPRKPR